MKLNIGIVGAGGFAHFAATAFSKVDGINIVAVTDINEAAVAGLANTFNALVYHDYETFLSNPNIELVYVSTPPYLHYAQSKQALLAGKHVICEKPAALHTREVQELATMATSLRLLYIANLLQRYNPMYAVVKKIVEESTLGNFLHGFFENYASDEKMNSDHWFWDEQKSGGIFIEHGVHFFDMFAGWLGKGKVISAVELKRPGSDGSIIDRMQATVLYKDGLVNFYHGFDQPGILDRQELRLLFEHGEITLYGWIPVQMKLHGLLQKSQLQKLKDILAGFSIEHHEKSSAGSQTVRGRFADISFDDHVTIQFGNIADKQNRYQEMLTAMITDQWNWIIDRTHVRVIDSSNAVDSVKMGVEAKLKAQIF